MSELSNLEKIVLGIIVAGLLVSAGWIPVKSYVMKKWKPHTQKVMQYPTKTVEYAIAIGDHVEASASYQFCMGDGACKGNTNECFVDIKAPLTMTLTDQERRLALNQGMNSLRYVVAKQDAHCGNEPARTSALEVLEGRLVMMGVRPVTIGSHNIATPLGGYGTPYYTSARNMAVIDKKMPKLTTGTNNTALGYQALKPKTTNGAEAVFYDGDSAHWWPKEASDGK